MKWKCSDGKMVNMAKAECEVCNDVMESTRPGDFVGCKCGQSFVDTDRWFPNLHRYGGYAKDVKKDKNEYPKSRDSHD